MKSKVLFTLIAALMLVTGAALAGEHFKQVMVRGGHGEGGPRMMMHGDHHRISEELGLSEDQKEAAKQIHEETWAKAEPLMEQHRQQFEEIHTLLDAGNANPTEIGHKAIAAHASMKQVRALHEEGMERFKALLTEEQKEKLETLEKESPGPHRGMRMRIRH